MPNNTDTDQAIMDLWTALRKLLPARIPGQVHNGEGAAPAKVTPLITLYRSDGNRVEGFQGSLFSPFEDGAYVLFEIQPWTLHETGYKVKRVYPTTQKEVADAIAAHEQRISPEIQQRIAALLVPAEQARARELDAKAKSNATSAQRLHADQEAFAAKLKTLEADKRALDERKKGLDADAALLKKRQDQLTQEVAIAVNSQVSERKLKLVEEDEALKQRAARLKQDDDALRRHEEQFIADRKVLAAARAQFESEGGTAYMAYVSSLGGDDSKSVTRLESNTQRPFDAQMLSSTLRAQGYLIPDDEFRRAVVATLAAWSSGQFVVLSGPTGVGKTQLVRQLAGTMGAGYGYIPVRPGWVEPADLLGFYNPMQKLFEPTPFIDQVLDAGRYASSNRLYAICLDEMNLSRIENYASDILSRVERMSVGEQVHLDLYSQGVAWRMREEEQELYREGDGLPTERRAYLRALSRQLHRYPATLQIPSNLVLFGTVNVDETTQMFSPKFLDRAYVLRFRPASLPEKVASLSQAAAQDEPLWPLSLERARQLYADPNPWPPDIETVWSDFRKWQSNFLKPLGVHFGHRFYNGFRRYVAIGHNMGLVDVRRLGDDYFQAKVAPRIRFGRDERAVGDGQTTKYQKLEEWLRDKKLVQEYSGFYGLLDDMYQRARSTEMVELWD
jgi:energy-coupling factor transporter ATP-binding protein EcfA2